MNPMGSMPLQSTILALGWTLVHFVWQGLLIASLLACANALLDRASSNARYLAACAAMLLMLAAPIATFATLAARAGAGRPALPPVTLRTVTMPARQALAAARLTPAPKPVVGARHAAPPAPSARAPFRWSAEGLASWLPWVVALWGAGVALLSLRLLGGWTIAQRLRRGPVTPAVSALQAVADRIAAGLRLARPVRLVVSLRVQVPTVIGWLKPILLVPSSALSGLTPAQLEAVLAHELAHVRRHDYLANLVQTAIETLLFYHPAVWWVGRQIRAERENSCDDVAVAWCGSAVLYARALTELEGLRAAPEPALAATGGSLVQRVMRLVRGSDRPRPTWMVGAVGIAAVFAMVGTGVTLTAAQQAPGGARVAAALARMSRQARGAADDARVAAASLRVQAALARIDASRAKDRADRLKTDECAKQTEACAKDAGSTPGGTSPMSRAYHAYLSSIHLEAAPPAPTPAPAIADLDTPAPAAVPAVPATPAPEFPAAAPVAVSAEQLVDLAAHGITPKVARDLAALGFTDPDDMVTLLTHDVSREYIRAFRKLGYDQLSADDFANLRQNGVTPDFVQDLRDMGRPPMEVEELIAMRQQGVSAEYAAAMKWLGFGELPLDKLIEMRNQGVTPDYVARLRVLGYRDLDPDELIAMRQQGIPPEYAGEMRMFGLGKLPVESLIALYQQGVTPDYVAGLRGLGYSFTPEELIAIRQQSVTTEWLAGVAAQGYTGLSADDLVSLRQQGVDGAFIREVRDAGYGRLPVEGLIRLRQIGLVTETPASGKSYRAKPAKAPKPPKADKAECPEQAKKSQTWN